MNTETRTKEQTTNNRELPMGATQMRAINGLLDTLRDQHRDCEWCGGARAVVLNRHRGKSSLVCRPCADRRPGESRAAAPKPLRVYKPMFHQPSRAAAPPSAPVVGSIARPMPFRTGRR